LKNEPLEIWAFIVEKSSTIGTVMQSKKLVVGKL
jgi:hypothetical protein